MKGHERSILWAGAFFASAIFPAYPAGPLLEISSVSSNVVMNFSGRLQASARIEGPFNNVLGATSPFVWSPVNRSQQFWRSRMGGMTFSAGTDFTVALKNDGSLWAWGGNDFGQLGIGEAPYVVPEPTRVGGDDWAAVACGPAHTVALKGDGSLWGWGATIRANQPEGVGTERDWVALAAGFGHSMALKANGSLWGWGENSSGQLGLGNRDYTAEPTQVGADTDWKTVACGFFFTLAIKRDGTLWAWGDNDGHESRSGNFVSTNVPTQFDTSRDWMAVACGFKPNGVIVVRGYAMGIKTNGSLWGWGFNHYGQLGTGTFDNSKQPVRIGTDTDWAVVSCGHYHTAALKTDGTLWAWGNNGSGELGTGTNGGTNNSPVQVGAETDWTAVSCGNGYSVALKQEGSLWGWGIDRGNRTNHNRPLLINSDTNWEQ